MARLLLASSNRGKLGEMQALLAGLDLEILTPAQLGIELEVTEDGSSYQENAARKATAYAQEAKILTLADDSGLEVEALGGLPGLISARFAPQPGATDADRRTYLLQRLEGLPQPWKAHFHCTVALALPGRSPLFTEGRCPGEIIPTERGDSGFGYDPIFLIPEKGRTMAELSMEEKNQVSHRARAVKAAIPFILELASG